MANLFDSIDTSNSGMISKSDFEQAFKSMNPPASFKAAGADTVWAKLDPNGTGQVSKKDFTDIMVAQMKALRGHHHHNDGGHHSSSQDGAAYLSQSASFLDALGSSNTPQEGSISGSILNTLA
jgi:hypothetical protein